MMSIREQESQLFSQWRAANPEQIFIEDGVIDEEGYKSAKKKTLFLLKEANSKEDNWKLTDFVGGGGRPQTWNNIYRWLWAIKHPEQDFIWTMLKDDYIDQKRRAEFFKSIAVMNIKKAPGVDTTLKQELYVNVRQNLEFVQKQLGFYQPDYLICCGADVAILFEEAVGKDNIIWEETKNGVLFAKWSSSVVIWFCHPEARIGDNYMFYTLLDAVREIQNIKTPEKAVWKRPQDILPEADKAILIQFKEHSLKDKDFVGGLVFCEVGQFDKNGKFYTTQGIDLSMPYYEVLYWSEIPEV